MDQNNPTKQDPNDLSFNVMPQGDKGFSIPTPSAPLTSNTSPMTPETGSHRWIYVVIGIIVLLALGGIAYYMLGINKPADQQQVTSKLPKVWLNQYFNADTCADQNTCGDNADPENDGLSNYDEFKALTNPLNPDTDSDGLADGDEVNIYKTDPTLKYTDRREVVAQNNWTDGVQIKNGFDPLTPALPFTATRKQQIATDTTTFKLHEPSITTTSTPTTTDQTANWKTYTNIQEGFEIKYPPTWFSFVDKSTIVFADANKSQGSATCKTKEDVTKSYMLCTKIAFSTKVTAAATFDGLLGSSQYQNLQGLTGPWVIKKLGKIGSFDAASLPNSGFLLYDSTAKKSIEMYTNFFIPTDAFLIQMVSTIKFTK